MYTSIARTLTFTRRGAKYQTSPGSGDSLLCWACSLTFVEASLVEGRDQLLKKPDESVAVGGRRQLQLVDTRKLVVLRGDFHT